MKSKNKIYIGGLILFAGAFTSCSDNYLDLAPQTQITNAQVIQTVDGANLAMIGVCQAMWQQYQNIQPGSASGYNFFNGEAYLNHRMNDAFGPDQHTGISLFMFGYQQVTQMPDVWGSDDYVINDLPWKYCYNLIQQSNTILDGIDGADGDGNQRKFVKAQVLTLRAHGYTKLMQYYGPRWEDSKNGNTYCAVMRNKGGIEDAPLCTMNDVFKLIYSDLDEAIELYQESGLKRAEKWMPDLSVAYGVYARAAMIIHDYEKAQIMAHNAWQGYEIMDNDTYLSGFYKDNNDLMWTCSPVQENLYYWSEFNMQCTNGAYTYSSDTADAIDIDLYNQMDPNDIRRLCYFTPDKIEYLQNINPDYNPANLTAEAFWNPKLVLPSNNCDTSYGPYESSRKEPVWGLYNVGFWWCYYYANEIFTGDLESIVHPVYNLYDYFTISPTSDKDHPLYIKDDNVFAGLNQLPLGAQFKFWDIAPYGGGAYTFMRSTELRLIEAEAAFQNKDFGTAKNIINSIRNLRIEDYKGYTGSDSDLLKEIQLEMRVETWGEGHNWSDFKRWNLPIERRAWVADDPTSGNWFITFARETPTNINSGWRLRIPKLETLYNKAIDRSLLDYSN